jgi:hypothetical protein
MPSWAATGRRAAVQQFDEENQMRYVSSFERIFSRRGMEQGSGKGQSQLLRMQIQ